LTIFHNGHALIDPLKVNRTLGEGGKYLIIFSNHQQKYSLFPADRIIKLILSVFLAAIQYIDVRKYFFCTFNAFKLGIEPYHLRLGHLSHGINRPIILVVIVHLDY
jgi:hypothetical protein